MDDAISAAADNIREQIQEKVDQVKSNPLMAEIVKLQAALNGLETLLGRPTTPLAQFFGLDLSSTTAPSAAIAPDEYVNVPALDAAKRYLRKVGKPARPFADIVRGVRSGGGVVNYEDKLRIQMVRSNDVKKVGEDLFGLNEWYPARKGRPPAEGGKAPRGTSLTELSDEGGDNDQPEGEEENASPDANE